MSTPPQTAADHEHHTGRAHSSEQLRRTLRAVPRRAWLLAAVVLLVVAALVRLAASHQSTTIPLDPDNAQDNGTRALAQVLRDQGVEIAVHRSVAALGRPDQTSTVVVFGGRALSPQQWARLQEATAEVARVVLVEPGAVGAAAFGAPVQIVGAGSVSGQAAGCPVGPARGLVVAARGGERYRSTGSAQVCFASGAGSGAGLLARSERTAGPGEVFLLGAGGLLSNEHVDEQGNAALALRLLGRSTPLEWVAPIPQPDDAPTGLPWPNWLPPVGYLLAVSVLMLMFVRGRRLGPLVPEHLPVVVRAVETTRARGQLYRRSADPARAAAVLRLGTRSRLARYVQQPAASEAELVRVIAVASGRDPDEVYLLLFGPPARTSDEMTTLAQHLWALEKEVRPR